MNIYDISWPISTATTGYKDRNIVKFESTKNFEKDYQALIDTVNTIQNKPKIYVCLPVPVYRAVWGINDSTLTAGVIPIIKKIARINHLTIIDLYNPMGNQPENFPDGIHPDENGAKNMAVFVAKRIKE